MKKYFELTTAVSRLADLQEDWLQYYDGIYLGDPFCLKLKDNLLNSKMHFSEAVNLLKKKGKKVYLSTPIGVTDEDFTLLREKIGNAIESGVDAVEVYDMGMLYFISRLYNNIPITVNSFIHVFNFQSAILLQEYGVKRFIPYPELDREELQSIKDNSILELELPVHGKMPLGYTQLCLIHKKEKDMKRCAGDCFNGYRLNSKFGKMRTVGRLTLSASDICLLNSLSVIRNNDFHIFRIEARFENNHYRARVGRIYREYITQQNDNLLPDTKSVLEALNKLSPDGFCNGYFFSHPGKHYFPDNVVHC